MKVWILTSEVNAYDQYGEYFEGVFKDFPSVEEIRTITCRSEAYCRWLIETGGGRQEYECKWYYLREEEI